MTEVITTLAQVRELLQQGQREPLIQLLAKMLPADKAELLEELDPTEKEQIFGLLNDVEAAMVLEEMDYGDQVDLVEDLGPDRASQILDEMSVDDAADLLSELTPGDAKEILDLMQRSSAEELRELLGFAEDTAGGLMTTEYVALPADISADQAIEHIRRLAAEAETVYYVYVTDAGGKLLGVLSFRELLLASPQTLLREVMLSNIISVETSTDQEEVARLVAKYNLLAIPVVDSDNHLMGIVTFDDAIDVIQEEATEDIYRMAGYAAPQENEFELGVWKSSQKRLPWLLGLLFGELLAGNVIKGFSGALETVTALAFFIPVMSGEAGNAATQSLAVVVRGLAIGEIKVKQVWEIVFKESRVGMVTGAFSGLVLAITAWLWQANPIIGLVTGGALVLNILVASTLGGFFPVVITRLGIDPAVASGPFITTLTDIISMLIYFTLAASFLHSW